MSDLLSLTPAGEDAWMRFKQHLEWSNRFALVFLFSEQSQVAELFRKRLAAIYRARVTGLELERPTCPQALSSRLLPDLIRSNIHRQALDAPLWVDLSHQCGQEWDDARANLLARLNERRERLLQHTRPLILLLPEATAPKVREMAPDLWAIRHFVMVIGPWLKTTPDAPPPVRPHPKSEALPFTSTEQAALNEWERIKSITSPDRSQLHAAQRASDACQQQGQWALKQAIDRQALTIARQLATPQNETPESLRDLSVSLDNAGNTQQALGEWEQAQTTFEEGLHLGLQLAKHLPNHPDYATLADSFTRRLQLLEKESSR